MTDGHVSVRVTQFRSSELHLNCTWSEVGFKIVFLSFQLLYEEVLSHSSPLETIATKGSSMAEHCATALEVQQLQSRYKNLTEKAKVPTVRASISF